ncbi:MAG TPA: RNB domain-containing ribonuclease, partial [Acidimicrobiales bacterium]|nr:RNB domain-containing ribonuclease [Acidimicrobiales bacterium]
LPDGRVPLHPLVISEGAASLLPDEVRQALVWTIELDDVASVTSTRVERALVRSRRAWAYDEAQSAVEEGTAPPPIALLAEVGPKRQTLERHRGGVSLDLPDQVVVGAGEAYRLAFRAPLPVEGWNAQISLLTGMEAARLMLAGGVGVLRTLPAPDMEAIEHVRRKAKALGVAWPEGASYADVIGALHADIDAEAVLLVQAARLLRGAAYEAFVDVPAVVPTHPAVAAPYAHVTAPLRRLVDRFGNEAALAACAGTPVPDWARDAMLELPEIMREARQREGAADRMAIDLMEAAVLSGRIGHTFEGVITSIARDRAQVQLREPAVVVSAPAGRRSIGDPVTVEVVAADPVTRTVEVSLHAR